MKLKDAVKHVFFYFCVVNTLLILFIAMQTAFIDPPVSFTGIDLLKIMSISFGSVLPVFIYVGSENVSRGKELLLAVLHFILTGGVVLTLHYIYDLLNRTNFLPVFAVFAVIYVICYIIFAIRDKIIANKINERINAFHGSENETHKK